MKTGLEGKPWYVGLGVGLAVGAVLFFLGWWRFFQPMRDQLVAGEAQLAELQTKLQEGRAAKTQLPKFREEIRQLELELDKLLRILPARRNTPDLLRRIRSLAEQGDFALKRFTPGQLGDKEFFSEWPIAVGVEGSYHNLALFFDRISRFSRIINIEDLVITALSSRGTHSLSAEFNAKTFVYKEVSPPSTTEAAGPAGGGGSSVLASAQSRASAGGGAE